jgi:hypothetical protein
MYPAIIKNMQSKAASGVYKRNQNTRRKNRNILKNMSAKISKKLSRTRGNVYKKPLIAAQQLGNITTLMKTIDEHSAEDKTPANVNAEAHAELAQPLQVNQGVQQAHETQAQPVQNPLQLDTGVVHQNNKLNNKVNNLYLIPPGFEQRTAGGAAVTIYKIGNKQTHNDFSAVSNNNNNSNNQLGDEFVEMAAGGGGGGAAEMAAGGGGGAAEKAAAGGGGAAEMAAAGGKETQTQANPCPILYDPCTGEPIPNNDISILEQRLRSIKKQRDITPIGLYGITSTTTMYDFLTGAFIDKDISLDDFVSFRVQENRFVGTDMFEVLSRIFVFFGGITDVNTKIGGNYHFKQRLETGGGHKIYSSPVDAFRDINCVANNLSGVSDITLVRVAKNKRTTNNNDEPAAAGGGGGAAEPAAAGGGGGAAEPAAAGGGGGAAEPAAAGGGGGAVEPTAHNHPNPVIPNLDNEAYCETKCKKPTDQIDNYIMSVKWRKTERNAEYVDIEKLYLAAKQYVPGSNTSIIVFIRSKVDFEKANYRMHRKYVAQIANKYFGWEEDVKPFLQDIRKNIFENSQKLGIEPSLYLQETYLQGVKKPTLSLQLHQEIISTSIVNSIQTQAKNTDNNYLIGVLPRGGKTYIAGGIISMLKTSSQQVGKRLNILWLTAAPTETLSQVQEKLIEKFADFDDFNFIDVKRTADISANLQKQHSFYFCSTQLLATSKPTTEENNKRQYLFNLLRAKDQLGLIFFDEAHKTGGGEVTKEQVDNILKEYEQLGLPFIFMSATYVKILFDYSILPRNTYIFDYKDIVGLRNLSVPSEQEYGMKHLVSRFRNPDLVNTIVQRRITNGESLEAMSKPYLEFPDLYFISSHFNNLAKERFTAANLYRPDSGFSFKGIFQIKSKAPIKDIRAPNNEIRRDAYKIFTNLTHPRNMIALLTPGAQGFDDGEEAGNPLPKEADQIIDPSILGRIDSISRNEDSRFRLDEQPTLLMFMPTGGKGSKISYLLIAWASLLLHHPWWSKNYEVACVVNLDLNADRQELAEIGTLNKESVQGLHIIQNNPAKSIINLEKKLHCSGKNKGLVILAGEKLSMGVSLPCVDAVFLFNDSKSPDDIIQKMYRALTPSIGKKSAFVVDLNPVRSFAAIYNYTRAASIGEVKTVQENIQTIYDIYSFDPDYFDLESTKGAAAKPQKLLGRLEGLYNQATKDREFQVTVDFKSITHRIKMNVEKYITKDLLKTVKQYITTARLTSDTKFRFTDDDNTHYVVRGDGKFVKRTMKPVKYGRKILKIPQDTIIIDNFVETLQDFIIYLAITSHEKNIESAISQYSSDNEYRQNINQLLISRGAITRSDPEISQIFQSILNHMTRSRGVMTLYDDTKSKVDDKSVRKNKILQIIHKRLTPRNKQKKDFGEVFTPIELIEDMLSHLPKSDWSNPNLKWLDPANGIGNFPVVIFYKLDEGLKKLGVDKKINVDFTNEKQRRKYIIENMLYMMELQSNNNRIAKNIFTSLCDNCTPNIWTVNTLNVTNEDIKKHFNIDKDFDRIIGNPPFQAFQKASGKRGGGDELYMKFVRKSLDLLKSDGLLVFVHPPSWRKPEFNEGRKKSKNAGMFDLMAHQNQLIYLEIHDAKDGLKIFKAATRYDFYVIKKGEAVNESIIKDMLGNDISVDLRDFNFLPNFNIKNVQKLFPKKGEESCELGKNYNQKTHTYENLPCVLFERSAYGTDKSWVSPTKTGKFKYPLIHTTPKDGPKFYYSKTNNNGMFGIPKVVFGESGINDPVIDITGEYGLTQGAIGLIVKSKKEAENVKTFLQSNFFKNILSACMWGNFRIDWRLFTYFSRNFWDLDVNLDEPILKVSNDEESSLADDTQKGGVRSGRYNQTRKNRRA